MGDLTKNISRKELACKCGCGFDTGDFETINAIQHLCDRFSEGGRKKVSIAFNCFCRCKNHNDDLREQYKSSGGKKGEDTAVNSQHIYGRAADIRLFVNDSQVDPKAVYEFFNATYPRFSVHAYQSFTHVDSRTNGPARW